MTENLGDYFYSDRRALEGRVLNVFHALPGEGLVVPFEVLRIEGIKSFAVRALWQAVVVERPVQGGATVEFEDGGEVQAQSSQETELEHSSLAGTQIKIRSFMRSEPAGRVVVYSDAPPEILENLQSVQAVLSEDVAEQLKSLFSIYLPQPPRVIAEDDRPYPGQYL